MWEIGWLRPLGVAAGFSECTLGLDVPADYRKEKHQWCPWCDVVQVQLLTPAVLTGQVSQALPVPLGYYYLHSQSSVCACVRACVCVCVVNRLIVDLSSALTAYAWTEVGQSRRSWEPASQFHHLQLLLHRPEAWGLNGGGEKRLNERTEISAAASSHMSSHSSDWTTPMFCWFLSLCTFHCLIACLPSFSVRGRMESGRTEKREIVCWVTLRKTRDMESTREWGCLGKRWKKDGGME